MMICSNLCNKKHHSPPPSLSDAYNKYFKYSITYLKELNVLGIFSLFKKKKKMSIDEEFKNMFGNELDNFAKKDFGIDLNKKVSTSHEDLTKYLIESSIPECSEHAYQKYLYGERMYKEGNLEKAISVLKKAIDLGNYSPAVYKRLAIIYRKQKDYNAELETIENALELYQGKIDVQTSYREFLERKTKVQNLLRKDK